MSYVLSPFSINIRNYTYRQRILIKQYYNDAVIDAFVFLYDTVYLQTIARKTGLLRARLRRYLYTQLIEQAIYLRKKIRFNATDFALKLNIPYAIYNWGVSSIGLPTYKSPTTPGTEPFKGERFIQEFILLAESEFRERLSRFHRS